MAYNDTVLKQRIALIPRYEFDAFAATHHSRQKIPFPQPLESIPRRANRQDFDRNSLRDITDNLMAQGKRLYHLGMKRTINATLARVNAELPASLCQIPFTRLLS